MAIEDAYAVVACLSKYAKDARPLSEHQAAPSALRQRRSMRVHELGRTPNT